jgi:hypothetical protein
LRIEFLEQRTVLSGPSALGHITDGQFDMINGHQEWSDVQPSVFPGSGSYLYADQANLNHPAGSPPDTFMLMYDETHLTTPLGHDDYFTVNFSTVENENGEDHLNEYTDHIYTDGTITFLENGVLQKDASGNARVQTIGGQQGQVGFGTSPNSNTPHVIAEFQIALSANQQVVNGGYSPDPLFWSSDPPPPPPPPCPPNTTTTIPVLINNYQGSGVTDAQAMQYVRDASNIYSTDFNNMVTLVPMMDQTGLPGGTMDRDARNAARTAGNTEVSNTFPGGKGLKIDFVAGFPDKPDSTGISVDGGHTSLITVGPANMADPGQTVAHEIGHDLGLDHSDDPTNLMYPSFDPHATGLTADQMMTICNNLSNFGTMVTSHSPGQLDQQQGGSVTDALGDVAAGVPSYFDLGVVNLASRTDLPDINAYLTLNGAFPSSGPVDATYRLLFNTDASNATGSTQAGFQGVDKEVLVHVTGDASVAPLAVTGTLIDYDAGGTATALPVVPQLLNQAEADSTSDDPVQASILLQIPKASLNLSVAGVPVGVASEDASGVEDTASLTFDGELYLHEPTLSLTQASAFVNNPVQFSVAGLHAGSAFTLSLGNQQVLSGTLDATGAFSGMFTVPTLPSGTNILMAQDATGTYAFNVLNIFPPLGTSDILPGFDAHTLAANDDNSTAAVPIGFTLNFFGNNYSSLFVNNNGNVTFDSALGEFTPFDLTSTNHVIIAPFFGDVDTSVGNTLTYGTGTVDGHAAFGVTWPDVGYFDSHTNKLNAFQLVLIDRSDTGAGNFDIEFNYGQIQWETGDASGGVNGLGGSSARAGFSNGTGHPGTFLELPGSGVNGAFLDSNSQTGLIHNSVDSAEPGQYVFTIRAGTPVAHQTAAFLQANPDGTTTVQPTSVLIDQEPSLLSEVERVVQFRVQAGLVTSPMDFTTGLVNDLVANGFIQQQESSQFINNVVQSLNSLAVTLTPPAPVEGAPLTNVAVATLVDNNPTDTIGTLTATITWGDGTTSTATAAAGTITQNANGSFNILGSHTYNAAASGLTFTVLAQDLAGAQNSQSAQINVQDAPVTLSLLPPAPTEGKPLANVVVATFRDANPGGTATNDSATITWGDGTSSTATAAAGTITQNADGSFSILGSHTYSTAASGLTFTVLVQDSGGAHDSQNAQINVQDAPLTLSLVPPSPTEGTPLAGVVVATFRDANPGGKATGYSATITWGDGTTTMATAAAGTITQNADGSFSIVGSHTYNAATNGLTFTVLVQDSGGAQDSKSAQINAQDAPVTLSLQPPAPTEATPLDGVVVATFRDANPGGKATDYTATIAWGDGTSSTATAAAGTITQNADGSFSILGSHIYVAATNGLSFNVLVQDSGGAQDSKSTTIAVQAETPILVPSGFGPGPDAFVTTVFQETLGRLPLSSELAFWSGKLAHGKSPMAVAQAIFKLPEHKTLVSEHLDPGIPFKRVLAAANHARKLASHH